MNIKKQNGGVWVKASDELPAKQSSVIVRTNYQRTYEIMFYFNEWNTQKFMFRDEKVIEWLKPIGQVYVLTEDELEILCSMTRLFNNEETKQFLKSITK